MHLRFLIIFPWHDFNFYGTRLILFWHDFNFSARAQVFRHVPKFYGTTLNFRHEFNFIFWHELICVTARDWKLLNET